MTDHRPRFYSDLSAKEARALLETYVGAHPRWVEEFLDEVRRRGGPAERLDFSRDSIEPLWEWLLATQRPPERPATDEEMRAADPPYWYDFRPGDEWGRELGPDLARFATLMAAYHGEMILRHKPASAWIVGTGSKRLGWFREPVLKVAGMGEMPATSEIVHGVRDLLGGEGPDLPSEMRRWFEFWASPDGDPAPIPESELDEPDYSVESIADGPGGGRFGFLVAFDDVVAHEQEDRVAAFVERLGREPAIAEAVHEDREVILVPAPGLTTEALEPIVARTWEEAASSSRRRIDVGPIV